MDDIIYNKKVVIGLKYFYYGQLTCDQRNKISEELVLIENNNKYKYFDIIKGPNKELILQVPLYFGIQMFGPPMKTIEYNGQPLDEIDFQGNLFTHQMAMVDKILANKKSLIQLNTGEGKTVISLYLLSKIKKKTLILVPTNHLVSQWIEEIHTFIDNIKVGRDYRDTSLDICITTVQAFTYSKKILSLSEIQHFGMIIYDEVHMFSSEQFIKSISSYGMMEYVYGFSATIFSLTGKVEMLENYFGKINDINDRSLHFNSKCIFINYKGNPKYNDVQHFITNNNVDNPAWVCSITTGDTKRMDLLIKYIEYVFNQITRKYTVLVFFEYINECNVFYNYLIKNINDKFPIFPDEIGIVHSDINNDDKKRYKKESKLLISTVKSLGTGFSRKDIHSVIIASPSNGLSSNQVQKIGRCLRRSTEERENNKTRYIIYINDNNCSKRKYSQDNFNLLKKYATHVEIKNHSWI